MNLVNLPTVTSFLLLLSTLCRAAPPGIAKSSEADVSSDGGPYDDVSGDGELAKRLSSFVRIGRPSSFVRIGRPSNFVRIGRASHFVRIGRPGNFVRIGRSGGDLGDLGYGSEGEDYGTDKRTSHFVRIGKGSRFVRIGKSGELMMPEEKRMPSFVRIGKAQPSYPVLYDDNELNKRASSFVRIGRSASSYVPALSESAQESGQAKALI